MILAVIHPALAARDYLLHEIILHDHVFWLLSTYKIQLAHLPASTKAIRTTPNSAPAEKISRPRKMRIIQSNMLPSSADLISDPLSHGCHCKHSQDDA